MRGGTGVLTGAASDGEARRKRTGGGGGRGGRGTEPPTAWLRPVLCPSPAVPRACAPGGMKVDGVALPWLQFTDLSAGPYSNLTGGQ